MDAILQPDLEQAAAPAEPVFFTRSANGERGDPPSPVPVLRSLALTPAPPAVRVNGSSGSRDRAVVSSWAAAVEEMDAAQLRSLVVSLPTIEQAKGLLMGYYGCDAAAAFAILRRWSSTRQVKIRDLAAALVDHAGREPTHDPTQADGLTASPAPLGGWPPFRGLQAFLDATGLA